MKALISGIAALFIAAAAVAQPGSGTVRYQETIRFGIPNLEGEAAQFAAMLPKEQRLGHVLYFSQDASMFQPEPREEKEADAAGDPQRGIQIRMDAPKEIYYTNVREGRSVALREFFGRKFLVSGAPRKQSWKITGNQKTILNYPCQEAVLYRERDTVTAWFTPAVPVSTGPRGLAGLPGLILAAEEGGRSSMVATSVEAGVVPAGAIAAPKGGKKVTEDEFRAIVDAKMKEMGASEGPGGEQVIIKVRHN